MIQLKATFPKNTVASYVIVKYNVPKKVSSINS